MGKTHDKIIKRQRIIAGPYKDENPTEVTVSYWIYAENDTMEYPSSTEKSGKWLIFVHESQIDQMWSKIKKSLEIGELGRSAKVSTSRPNPNARDPDKHVICVYTYDSDDIKDVMRIRLGGIYRVLGGLFSSISSWSVALASLEDFQEFLSTN